VVRLVVLAGLAAAGLAVRDRLEAGDDLGDADEALVVLDLDPPAAVRVVVADLVVAGWPAVGLAEDIALAASVSDLLAVVMALVAAFIACIAVDIVLAEDVALVAAAVIFVAAAVTLVAADETVRAAVAGVAVLLDEARGALPDALRAVPRDELPEAPRDAPLRVVLAADALVCVAGRLAERRDVLLLDDLVPVRLAGPLRAEVRVVVRAGTVLPPVLINQGVLFHPSRRFTRPLPPRLGTGGPFTRRTMAPSRPKTATSPRVAQQRQTRPAVTPGRLRSLNRIRAVHQAGKHRRYRMGGQHTAAAAGTIDIGGDLTVNRLGYGAMRITGPGIWKQPPDREQAKAALRRAIELDVNFIDTADSYGPEVSEELIAEALHPYPDDLVIATKGGLVRPGPGRWDADGRPEHLRQACEGSLSRLRLEQIPLYQFHRPDPKVPIADSIGTLVELKAEGKIRHIGVSNFSEAQLREVEQITPVVSLQNRYNASDRSSETLVDLCEQEQLVFLPWAPIQETDTVVPLRAAASRLGVSPRQVVLAWLLQRSPQILPIPGSGSPEHVEDNIAAASLELTNEEINSITDVVS
jgi:aryl-alcohol dehydrogenase-like predicted oxidoreductase